MQHRECVSEGKGLARGTQSPEKNRHRVQPSKLDLDAGEDGHALGTTSWQCGLLNSVRPVRTVGPACWGQFPGLARYQPL